MMSGRVGRGHLARAPNYRCERYYCTVTLYKYLRDMTKTKSRNSEKNSSASYDEKVTDLILC